MSKEIQKTDNQIENQLTVFEDSLQTFLGNNGLPSEGILVEIRKRKQAIVNLPEVVSLLQDDIRSQSVYISKFVAAVATGLFDAALNYLWDETILHIRSRVIHYDISYFFDNAVRSQEKRKRLKDESDLDKIDDSELIYGAHQIGLISDVGFKHLEYIRYMRNWCSAAHPNQNELTGLQLITWLETCLQEVITLPISDVNIEIKRLLSNVKSQDIDENEAKEIGAFFLNLNKEQASNICYGFFGIYTRKETEQTPRDNIKRLLPYLWDYVNEETREQIGVRYGKYVANSEQEEKKLAREFLAIVGGEKYIPSDLRAIEIENALDDLLSAHRGSGNFYSEPLFAKELRKVTNDGDKIPSPVLKKYIYTLVEVFISNGNGIAWNAEPHYKILLSKLDQKQAIIAIFSFLDKQISNRLQLTLCKKKFVEMIDILEDKITSESVSDVVHEIKNYSAGFDKLAKDSKILDRVKSVRKLIHAT